MNQIQKLIGQAKTNANNCHDAAPDMKYGSAEIQLDQGELFCSANFYKSNYARRPNWKIRFYLDGKVISRANVEKLLQENQS